MLSEGKSMCTKDILANRVRVVRMARGLSQAQLAEMVGYTSRASINKIEKGLVDVPRSKLFALADALHVSPAFLLGLPEGSQVEGEDRPPLDEETAQMLQDLYDKNSALLDSMADATPEELAQLQKYIDFIKSQR